MNNKISFFSLNQNMKFVLFFLIFFQCLVSFSQDEVLSPLIRVGQLNQDKRDVNDSLFVYFTDTLSLPIIDDFSQDHF